VNAPTLVFSYIKQKPLTWCFHALTLALGVAVVTGVLLVQRALDERFNRDIGGIDLVVGAKGSPLQLILSCLFQIDQPTGNITLQQADRLAHSPFVRLAAPVSIGDNVRGVRIVGTTNVYPALYGATVAQGRWWKRPMEAVAGSAAFHRLGLRIGQTFVGEHGLSAGGEEHRKTPYRLVGVLTETGTVADQLVLTDPASVWRVHADETDPSRPKEVTALLVRYRSTMGAVMMPQWVRAMPDLQAAVPAIELARLNRLFGSGGQILRAFGIGLLAIAAFGFFLTMFGAVNERQRDLALLRTLGARPVRLAALICSEGLLLGLLSGIVGVCLARGAISLISVMLSQTGGPVLELPELGYIEIAALGGALAIALSASALPCVLAYRVEPAKVLKESA
jgi:putative ABC transport system permease protein